MKRAMIAVGLIGVAVAVAWALIIQNGRSDNQMACNAERLLDPTSTCHAPSFLPAVIVGVIGAALLVGARFIHTEPRAD